MAELGAAQRDGHGHAQPASEQRRRVSAGIAEVSVDQRERKRPAQTQEEGQASQRHEKAIESSEQAWHCEEARKIDVETVLPLLAGGYRTVAGAEPADCTLQR